jgi:hypothetical protein
MIQNLKNLHVPVDSRKNTIAEGAPEFNKDRAKEDAKEAEECDRRVRYVSKIDRAVQQLFEGKLSKEKYPYVNREGKADDEDEAEDDGTGAHSDLCASVPLVLKPCTFVAGDVQWWWQWLTPRTSQQSENPWRNRPAHARFAAGKTLARHHPQLPVPSSPQNWPASRNT